MLDGCASPAQWFSNDTHDEVEGVVAPSKTLLELKKLAKQAKGASADQKRATSVKLTEMIKREDDPAIRAQIIRTLGHYDTPLAGEVLAASLRDSDPAVRIAGCKAWVRRRGKEAVGELSGALKEKNHIDVRLAAAEGLGQLGDADAVEALASALGKADASWQRTDPALQYRIVKSLERITGRSYHNDFGAWQQYARGERPRVEARPVEESLADKFRRFSPF
ncbi:MAG: HEAT repeat domain-containing protein [Planctomycetes bacterium]|nr:HEAT repeat domain-containing protein [Planctomycetota bacterium]